MYNRLTLKERKGETKQNDNRNLRELELKIADFFSPTIYPL